MTYTAPVSDIAHTLYDIAGLRTAIADGALGDLSADLVDAVLEEAGKFASQQIAPLNQTGDRQGAPLNDGMVTMPDGWLDVYRQWAEAGWAGLPAPEAFGGQGLPTMLAVAVQELWNAASMAFGIGTVLTHGAVEALVAHASPELQERYLPKLVSGEWTGTMNLTEPQAGSDLGALRSRAVPQGDGTYRISGTKIFITYGEHDLTDNILHLVLARLPDAPSGTKGISLFLVPKILLNDDGSLGARNDVKCVGVEHKLGIHASPTCTMAYGEGGGAIGYLVGEENRGLACMFTMMNNARLQVGIQGVAIAERAYQQALAYARERKQGRAPGAGGPDMSPIIEHPDVQRMLLTMKALTHAARAICYVTAAAIDQAHRDDDEARRAEGQLLANLLTPVAKAFATDIGVDVASLGVQVHGGMGYVEETGAAQHLRDARITPIYEGTNGIQAIDLVMRKITQDGGDVVAAYIEELRQTARVVMDLDDPALGQAGYCLNEAVEALEEATNWLLKTLRDDQVAALAGATPYLRLFGLTAGGAYLTRGALAARNSGANAADKVALARFYAETLLGEVAALRTRVITGAPSFKAAAAELLAS